MPLKLSQTPSLIFKSPRSSKEKKSPPIGFETKDNVTEFCDLGQRSEAKVTGYGTTRLTAPSPMTSSVNNNWLAVLVVLLLVSLLK